MKPSKQLLRVEKVRPSRVLEIAFVTGGGSWTTINASNVVTGSGTYQVTGVVRWERAPFEPGGPPPRADLIGNPAERSTGLAVLHIVYSDRSRGILVVSYTGATAPANLFEGITASKSFVDYWNRVAPAPDVDANRTLFHVTAEDEE